MPHDCDDRIMRATRITSQARSCLLQLPINGQPRAAMGCRAVRIKPQTIVAAIGLVCLWSYFVTPRR
jgi:hypothetical protein